MSIELFFSNKVECLAEKLSENLSLELVEKHDKFDPMVVIVPNQNMVKWLQLTLSRLQSVILNLRFEFLENGLWFLLAELDQQRLPERLMDQNMCTLKLVQCLKSLDLQNPALAPMAAYLNDGKGNQRADLAPRLWQLAEKLSYLFQEYEYHRADMMHAWRGKEAVTSSMERCQRYLYRAVYCQPANGEATNTPIFISLLQYAHRILGAKKGLHRKLSRTIHIFGLSQISNFHYELLHRLGTYHCIYFYTLNPSKEFWEDIQTPGEQRWSQKKQGSAQLHWRASPGEDEPPVYKDHPLLAVWGKMGRENVRRLCSLTDYTFNDCYCPWEDQTTVLHQLQDNLLTLASDRTQTLEQDRSLQIFASPSKFREVETVYNTIYHNLRQNDALKLTDMAILVPDMNLYKPIFDAVFNRRPNILSYNIVDSNAQAESLYGQAISQILHLTQERFSRKAVFELLLNPCLMQRWDISVEELRDWVQWADELNVFHTYSRKDSQTEPGMVKERFSWKQALYRLRMGRIMSASDESASPMRDFCDVIPFVNIASANLKILEKFCIVLETLDTQIQTLSSYRGTAEQWARRFAAVCDSLIQVPAGNRGEDAVAHAVFQGLEELKSTASSHQGADQNKWDINLFREYILFRLKGISGGRGDYLTGGVTISALHPMRPIPFKIIFVLGMEEGQFPGRETVSTLDLRHSSHRREDITLPERNCYLFLEMLLSVRQKLYLGFVARDLQKDRAMQPCSVINQLRHHLAATILPDGKDFKIAQIPLKGNDPSYLDIAGNRSWSDVTHNYSLSDRMSVLRSCNHWPDFLKHASTEDMRRLRTLVPVLNTSVTLSENINVRKQVLAVRHLARFFMNPVRLSAQYHLGLYAQAASIEDLAMKADEPFFSEFPLDYTIKMQCLCLWLDFNFDPIPQAPSLEREPDLILKRVYADYEKQSAAPEGVYGTLDRQTILRTIQASLATLGEPIKHLQAASVRYRSINWGILEANETDQFQTEPVLILPALEIASSCLGPHGGQQQFLAEIHAALNWVWQDDSGVWHTIVPTGSKRGSNTANRYLLKPLLTYLVAMSQDHPGLPIHDHPMQFHLVYETKIQTVQCGLTQTQAAAYLKNILEAFGNQREFHWLPFETVLKCKNSPHRNKADAFHPNYREGFCDEMVAHFAEVDDYLVKRLAAPITPDIFDLADKRFGWIFDNIEPKPNAF